MQFKGGVAQVGTHGADLCLREAAHSDAINLTTSRGATSNNSKASR